MNADRADRADPADPADLEALRAAFETEHGIVLPEPYRTFVAEICDGYTDGPPDYGLVALADVPADAPDDYLQQSLAEPFPLTEAWLWEDEDDPRPEEEIEAVLDRVFGHGSIVLGTDGCGMNWHLIVSGPHRGHVWTICGEGAQPFGAEFGHTSGESGFAGWAAHWAAGTPWWDVV